MNGRIYGREHVIECTLHGIRLKLLDELPAPIMLLFPRSTFTRTTHKQKANKNQLATTKDLNITKALAKYRPGKHELSNSVKEFRTSQNEGERGGSESAYIDFSRNRVIEPAHPPEPACPGSNEKRAVFGIGSDRMLHVTIADAKITIRAQILLVF